MQSDISPIMICLPFILHRLSSSSEVRYEPYFRNYDEIILDRRLKLDWHHLLFLSFVEFSAQNRKAKVTEKTTYGRGRRRLSRRLYKLME